MVHTWRVGKHSGNVRAMSVHRQQDEIEAGDGLWVATKDGQTIASATTSSKLLSELTRLGDAAFGAVARFVPGKIVVPSSR